MTGSLCISLYESMSSSDHDNLASYFSNLEKPFISLSCLSASVRISTNVFNKSHDSDHSCIVPPLREKSSSFDIQHDVSHWLIKSGFITERGYFFMFITHVVFQSWKKIEQRCQKYILEKRQHFQQTVPRILVAHM